MFCKNCGQNLPDGSAFCGSCGAPQAETAAGGESMPNAAPPYNTPPSYQQPSPYQPYAPYRSAEPDVANTGLNVLSFFFPLIGLILYIMWNKEFPVKAKAIGKWALIGVCVAAGLGIITGILGASFLRSIYY